MPKPLLLTAAVAVITAACSLPGQLAPRRPEPTRALAPGTPAAPTLALLAAATPSPAPAPPPSLAGLRVVFDRDGAVWLWQDGVSRSLAEADYPASARISDDGQVVAFLRGGELWAIAADGTQERLLVGGADLEAKEPGDPGVRVHQFDWLPGSHRLVYNTSLLVTLRTVLTDDLHLVDADTRERLTLLAPKEGGLFHLSPDGLKMAVVSPRRIGVLNAGSIGFRTLLEYAPVEMPSGFAYYAQPVWAPDSQSLLVAILPRDIHSGSQSPATIWRLPLHGAPAVASRLVAGHAEYISPDLARVVSLRFVRDEGSHVFYRLYIGSTDGSGEVLYYEGAIGEVVWAPGSGRFACWLHEEDRYYLGGPGAGLVPISEPSETWGGLVWIDASHFIYTAGGQARYELRLGTLGQPSLLLAGPAEGLGSYDFTTVSAG